MSAASPAAPGSATSISARRGKVPHYVETFVDEGDINMAEIVRILRDEDYGGVLIPDHTPG